MAADRIAPRLTGARRFSAACACASSSTTDAACARRAARARASPAARRARAGRSRARALLRVAVERRGLLLHPRLAQLLLGRPRLRVAGDPGRRLTRRPAAEEQEPEAGEPERLHDRQRRSDRDDEQDADDDPEHAHEAREQADAHAVEREVDEADPEREDAEQAQEPRGDDDRRLQDVARGVGRLLRGGASAKAPGVDHDADRLRDPRHGDEHGARDRGVDDRVRISGRRALTERYRCERTRPIAAAANASTTPTRMSSAALSWYQSAWRALSAGAPAPARAARAARRAPARTGCRCRRRPRARRRRSSGCPLRSLRLRPGRVCAARRGASRPRWSPRRKCMLRSWRYVT